MVALVGEGGRSRELRRQLTRTSRVVISSVSGAGLLRSLYNQRYAGLDVLRGPCRLRGR
jgi:hypothetical protein